MGLVTYTPNTQYYGLTGRKSSIPYNKMLMAQMPAARQFLAEEAMRLQREDEFNQAQALQRKARKAQEKQATTDALIRGGNLAMEVGKLTKDSWMPILKEGASNILGRMIPDLQMTALKEILPQVAAGGGAELIKAATPIMADAAKDTVTGLAGQAAIDAGKDALTGTITTAATQEAAQQGIMNALGQTLTSLAANIGNYMNPWAAVAHAAGKLGGWGLQAIGANNDMDWLVKTGKTFDAIDSGTGIGRPWLKELISDKGTKDAVLETMDVFNPVGGILSGNLGDLWENAVKSPAESGAFLSGAPGSLLSGIYDSIWGSNAIVDAGAAVMNSLLDPTGGVVSNLVKSVSKACVIITACTSDKSPEVEIARAYRDKYLTTTELRGYYMLAEKLVPQMIPRPRLTRLIRNALVKPLIAYGAHALGKTVMKPAISARIITRAFLILCRLIGKTRKQFTRANGEVI